VTAVTAETSCAMASLGYAAPQLPLHAVILNMTERENVCGKQVRACSRARCSCHSATSRQSTDPSWRFISRRWAMNLK
jgi:hypothetical protein